MSVVTASVDDLDEKLFSFIDPRFRFDPVEHRYFYGTREMTSATRWLERFKEPFDRVAIAARCAARSGRPAGEFLAEWERAAEIGTKTHAFIEHYYDHQRGLLASVPDLLCGDGEVSLRCLKFLALAGERLANYEPLAQELRVFYTPPSWLTGGEEAGPGEEEGFCGTLDMLARHKPTGGLYVIDWKTSKKCAMEKNGGRNKLKGAFADLTQHEHNVYSLQVSFYRVLLERAGIATAGGAIAWLPTGHTAAELIPTLDYRSRVRSLLM